jgi:fructose-1,6-bisphosphatase I
MKQQTCYYKPKCLQYSSGELSRIINSIRLAAKVVNYKVNKAGLVDIVELQESKIFKVKTNKIYVYAKKSLFKLWLIAKLYVGSHLKRMMTL